MKLLLVDDSETMRQVITRAVCAAWPQTEFVEAGDVEAAGRVLEAADHGVGLILLDYNLPGGNGLELLRRLRENEALREIPVVMITVDSEKAAVIRALHEGARGYVPKPFDEGALQKRIAPFMKMGVEGKVAEREGPDLPPSRGRGPRQ